MIFALVTSRIKNKFERKRNITIMIAVMLVCVIISSTGMIYSNARRTIIEQYWAKNGSADLIIFGNKDKLSSIDLQGFKYEPIWINTSGELIEHGKFKQYGAVGYAYIEKVNKLYSLELADTIEKNTAIITSNLAKELDVKKDEIISINNARYKVAKIINSIDIFGKSEDIVIVNGVPYSLNIDTMVLFVNCDHNAEKINNLINYLEAKEINYVDRYKNIKPIMDDFANLLSSIYLLFSVIALVGGVLVYNTYSINVRKRLEYWGILRTLGLKKSKAIITMVVEICFYSILGILFGVAIGTGIGLLICILTNTNIYFYIPENSFIIAAITISLVAPIISVLLSSRKLFKKSPIEMLLEARSSMNKYPSKEISTIKIVIGILLILLSTIDLSSVVNLDKNTFVLVYSLQILFGLVGTIFLLVPFIKLIVKFLMERENPSLRLACINIKTNLEGLKGIIVAISLTVVILYTIVGVSTNFKDWAVNMADRQLNFDFQIVYGNNSLDVNNAKDFIAKENIKVIGQNYFDIGNINGLKVYICAMTAKDFNAMYNANISENSISGKNVVLSSIVMEKLNIKPGDKVNLSLNGIEKNVRVAEKVNLLDNSLFAVYVPNDLFDISNYKNIRVCGKLNVQNSIHELKLTAFHRNLIFYSMNDIKTQWKENIVKGIQPIEYIIGAIIFVLVLLLRNTILINAEEKKQNFLILISIGLKRQNIKKILVYEYLITELSTVLVSIVVGTFVSQKFVEINSITSGFHVDYKPPVIQFVLIGIAVLIFSYIFASRVFGKIASANIINEIRYY
ncbi:FtsX-like permease family protein [Thermoanaerobacter sp. A7A]|uniref:ABC transporter permease n=1 Tax=Thermoanaerobacter sp. A7A TaxID=1350366 RepID=UPI00040A1262|nr:FtsX-like permease family protein [Thermoanaerobacter sp. A7A]